MGTLRKPTPEDLAAHGHLSEPFLRPLVTRHLVDRGGREQRSYVPTTTEQAAALLRALYRLELLDEGCPQASGRTLSLTAEPLAVALDHAEDSGQDSIVLRNAQDWLWRSTAPRACVDVYLLEIRQWTPHEPGHDWRLCGSCLAIVAQPDLWRARDLCPVCSTPTDRMTPFVYRWGKGPKSYTALPGVYADWMLNRVADALLIRNPKESPG